ncbi:MAG: hypothetical protein JNK48_25310 [Bryobacterales bacterium]|nr:hypothetical protein [Bryobacterales bacterium]
MNRRGFFQTAPGLGLAALPAKASDDSHIYMALDGVPLTTGEYTAILSRLKIEKDSYSQHGVVAELEKRVAADLGKEAAVWMPTGTLANHLAVRLLAGEKRRVLVQAESHLWNDCGDCAQTLSGIHMVGLAPGKATFRLEEVEAMAGRGAGSRVAVPIGAIQIESPVRRKDGERFDFEEMRRVAAWARQRGIGMHLDGARLHLEAGHTGIPVRQYADLFDTVYVSMYKYFNAASGAVLAGPRALLENAFHIRRMFGGGLQQVWPYAAVALHYYDGFGERYRKAVETAEAVIAMLSKDGGFDIARIAQGSNIFRFRPNGVNAPVYQQRLQLAGITAAAPQNDWFLLRVNETWNRAPAAEIFERFRKALG